MSAAQDDRLVADALSRTPVTARELELQLGVDERRVSSALGRLRQQGLVERRSSTCAHCSGRGRLTTWKASRRLADHANTLAHHAAEGDAVGLVQRPSGHPIEKEATA